jgi:hypothetical protein
MEWGNPRRNFSQYAMHGGRVTTETIGGVTDTIANLIAGNRIIVACNNILYLINHFVYIYMKI